MGYHNAPVSAIFKFRMGQHRRLLRDLALYGVCGGLLITALRLMQYRFLVVEYSVEIYSALVAAFFAAVGIWLGVRLNRKRLSGQKDAPQTTANPFVADEAKLKELGITPREVEILGLIASGMSNREIAARLFVSENTVKTHSSRLFDKLRAKRRTQAVQLGKAARLIP